MIVWIIIFVIICVGIILISTYALPSAYLKFTCKVKSSKDRCVKRVYEKNGQSLVFEPEIKWRKYVKQYLLSERKNRKVAVCKVDDSVKYLEYDLIVFDAYNQPVKVLNVKDYVRDDGFTKEVELPEETSYVSLKIIRANDLCFDDKMAGKLKKGNLGKFIFVNIAVVLAETICLRICLANLLGGIFRESFVLDLRELTVTAIMALALIVVNSLTTLITVKAIERKNVKKENKNA